MRWLFLLVLSLNIVYIAWQVSVPPADDYAQSSIVANAKTIVLLRELKEGAEAEAHVAERVTEQSDAVRSGTGQQDINVETPSVADEKQIVSEGDPQEIEPDKATVREVAQQDVAAKSCFTVGPFRDLENLRGYVREIKSYVVQANFRDREEQERSIYWVYIKPEKNRKNAIGVGRRLKAKKIKDYYIIREGEKNNGISLGHFKNKKRAYGLAKKVKKLGFDVLVEPIFKTYTLYWLDYQLVSGTSIPQTIDGKYIRSNSNEKISRLNHDCET